MSREIGYNDKNFLIDRISDNLKEADAYCYATAYFTFSALEEYLPSLEIFLKNGNHAKFIISTKVEKDEFNFITKASRGEKEKFFSVNNSIFNDEKNAEKIFEYISSGKIEFKMAIAKSGGIFHSKFGYIENKSGGFAWSGSINHTYSALKGRNVEQLELTNLILDPEWKERFNDTWENKVEGIEVVEANRIVVEEILSSTNGEQLKFDIETWLTSKYKFSIFLEEDKLKITSNTPFDIFDIPSIFWVFSDDYKSAISNTTFNKLRVLRWIEENEDIFVSSAAMVYMQENITSMKDKIKRGHEIKNNWPKISESKHFADFKFDTLPGMKRKPFPLQLKQAYYAAEFKKSMNLSVPGTGKTMVALTLFNYLKNKNKANRIIVVGPTSSHKPWEEEFEAVYGREPHVLNLSDIANSDEKHEELVTAKYEKYDLILMHFASASIYTSEIISIMTKNDLFVVDEAHYIKSEDKVWGKQITKLGKASEYNLLLTGTPAPNGIDDIHNLLVMTFGEEFLTFFKQQNDFASILNSLFMRVNYEDLEMQFKQNDKYIDYELDDEQVELLDKFKSQILTKESDAFSLLIKTIQSYSSPELAESNGMEEDNDFVYPDSPKLDKLLEVVEKNKNKNMIIWANFRASMSTIEKRLKEKYNRNIYKYNGLKSKELRNRIIELYKRDGGILIANPQTLAESVSLHMETDLAIYYEYDFSLTNWQQSRNRTFRYGMNKDAEYVILKCSSHPLDSKMLEILSEKAAFQSNLINTRYEDLLNKEDTEASLDEYIERLI